MSIPEPAGSHDGPTATALRVRRIATVLSVAGEVDAATATVFHRALDQCDRDHTLQALDLTGVTFFSAAGVGRFVRAGWPTRPHDVVIASPDVRRMLELCDLGFLLNAHGWTDAFDGWVSDGASPDGAVGRPRWTSSPDRPTTAKTPARTRPHL